MIKGFRYLSRAPQGFATIDHAGRELLPGQPKKRPKASATAKFRV